MRFKQLSAKKVRNQRHQNLFPFCSQPEHYHENATFTHNTQQN